MDSFKLPDHIISKLNGSPYSELFQDIFHSKNGALEEASHVFVNGNFLHERLEKLESPKYFSICELGFGFGVSLLSTWQQLQKYPDLYLSYTSIEGFPVSKLDLENFYNKLLINENNDTTLESLREFTNELIELYPPRIKGHHQILLANGRCSLTLIFNKINTALHNINSKFDAWYLDGFSPKKNSEMWSKEVFNNIRKNSKLGTTFSTYSCSRPVIEAAEEAGFKCTKIKGHGEKKEMTIGELCLDNVSIEQKKIQNKKVAIIGGGLSGIAAAHSLSQRGLEVTIFEKEPDFSTKASGNLRAVIMPQISSVPDMQCRYYLAGYLYSLRLIAQINKQIKIKTLSLNGALRYCNVKKWKSVWSKIEELGLESIITKQNDPDSLLFKEGGSIQPKELLQAILELGKKNIELKLNSKIEDIKESESKVTITCSGAEYEFDHLIFAGGFDSAFQKILEWVPVEKIKGELCHITLNNFSPEMPLCYDGYLVPVNDNEFVLGATYEHNSHIEETNPKIFDDLIHRLEKTLNLNSDSETKLQDKNPLGAEYKEGRVCFRTTSPDRVPIIGRISENSKIHLSLGHGSRGMVSTFLAAEIIAAEILNTTSPVEADLLKELSPVRFKNREKKRGISIQEIYPASFIWRS